MTFIVTPAGKPYEAASFGKLVRAWCNEAGLPHCSAHGLRKAAARRLAEAVAQLWAAPTIVKRTVAVPGPGRLWRWSPGRAKENDTGPWGYMARPYSSDLRERVVEAVNGGAIRSEAAECFGVGVSSAVRWHQAWRETGTFEAKPRGGSNVSLDGITGQEF